MCIQVPEFSSIQDNIKKRGPQRRPAPPRQPLSAGPKKPKSFEDEFWENYSPPKYLTNKYVWAAACIIGLIAAYYSYLYKDCIPQTFQQGFAQNTVELWQLKVVPQASGCIGVGTSASVHEFRSAPNGTSAKQHQPFSASRPASATLQQHNAVNSYSFLQLSTCEAIFA
eukprot:TRINITY_DN35623_c0_g1_i1.p2 TRINITY_DN35623_c0_g1~~TRINITY_DN35623_c0_g1_i1.p2  ORF type:complete len:169 (+),score=2.72 TRINITY_DN35623_c0_g1_i1:31-537(+)